MSLNETKKVAGSAYQQELARNGAAGTPGGNAMMAGFMDGYGVGYQAHRGVTIPALEALREQFREPLSIKTAREMLDTLIAAVKS